MFYRQITTFTTPFKEVTSQRGIRISDAKYSPGPGRGPLVIDIFDTTSFVRQEQGTRDIITYFGYVMSQKPFTLSCGATDHVRERTGFLADELTNVKMIDNKGSAVSGV